VVKLSTLEDMIVLKERRTSRFCRETGKEETWVEGRAQLIIMSSYTISPEVKELKDEIRSEAKKALIDKLLEVIIPYIESIADEFDDRKLFLTPLAKQAIIITPAIVGYVEWEEKEK